MSCEGAISLSYEHWKATEKVVANGVGGFS